MDDLSEDAAARKWSCKKGTKKVRFFTCAKTFFTWTGFGFRLHDMEEDEEEGEDEEDWEEEEVQVYHNDGKIFPFFKLRARSFCT